MLTRTCAIFTSPIRVSLYAAVVEVGVGMIAVAVELAGYALARVRLVG